MKQIEPYKNIHEAITSLDNGGQFYNFLTYAADGIIAPAELGKVGGLFNEKQKLILFLELSISALDKNVKTELISKFDDELKKSYQKYKAQELLAAEANEKGIIASNAIITGIPKIRESKSDLGGFVMIPIMAGKVMTFIMIPIFEQYDVYEIRDDEFSETFLIAHAKGSEKLPEQKMMVAGILKELKQHKNEASASQKFLEINYFLNSN